MDADKVDKYLGTLKQVLDEHQLHNKASSIWNMDETG